MALTNAEKQARWRERRDQRVKALEQQVVGFQVEVERLRNRGKAPEPVPGELLPKTAQKKLEAAITREKRQLAAEFEQIVQAEIKRRIDETVLPHYNEKLAEYDEVIKARKGLVSRKDYLLIASCLHPDQSASKQRMNDAFIAFTRHEIALCSEKERPTVSAPTPRTYEEMMKRREEMKAKRKQQRANAMQRR
jgi:hypothetical protein